MEPSKKWVRELLALLPEWAADGTVSEESAARLRLRYGNAAADSGGTPVFRHLQAVLSILCGLLFGGGLILLISHNWDEFSPAVRMGFAYLPLLAGIGFGFFTVLRHGDDPRFTEPAALWLAAAAASALAIVSQLYHTSGTLPQYLTAVLLVSILPLYVFRGAALMALYTVGCVVYAANTNYHGAGRLLCRMLILVLPLLPLLIGMALRPGAAIRRRTARLSFAVLVILVGGIISGNYFRDEYLGMTFWALIAALFCFAGRELARREEPGRFGNLFWNLGWYGILVFLFVISSREFGWYGRGYGLREWQGAVWLALPGMAWGAAAVHSLRYRKDYESLSYLAFPLLPLLCLLFSGEAFEGMWRLIANLYLAAIGIGLLITGVRRRNLWRLNGGLLLLSLQIFLQFIGVGDIMLYAAVFLALGALVLVVNFLVSRQLRKEA